MNLLMAWNAWSLVQYLLITKWDTNCQVVYWKSHYICEVPREFRDLCESVLKPFMNDCVYEKVYVPSALTSEDVVSVVGLQYTELHIMEEGAFDYCKHEQIDLLTTGHYHSMNLNLVWKKEIYKTSNWIEWDESIASRYLKVIGCNVQELNVDMIVYTDPLDIDYGIHDYSERLLNYLETDYKDFTILIKRHPRDRNVYNSDSLNMKLCNDMVPAQLLRRLDCLHLYVYVSTGLFYMTEKKKIRLLQYKEVYKPVAEFQTVAVI